MGKVRKKKYGYSMYRFLLLYFLKKKVIEYIYLFVYKCSIFERMFNKLVYVGCFWREEFELLRDLGGGRFYCIFFCVFEF